MKWSKVVMTLILFAIPLMGYTATIDVAFEAGVAHQKQITLQKQVDRLSAFVSESEADLFTDNIVADEDVDLDDFIGAGKRQELSRYNPESVVPARPTCNGKGRNCSAPFETGWRRYTL